MNALPLADAILTDQLMAVRRTVEVSIPVNITLGVAVVLVAWHAGEGESALAWFTISSIVNLLRILACRLRDVTIANPDGGMRRSFMATNTQLRAHWILALMSGTVWAFIPLLCDGYQSPQTIFYLTVVCGITAGAVTHGFAYARIPICFITPPLVSVIVCLIYAGGFERYYLAATVVLYLAALIRGSRISEAQVKNESRLKHEATSLSLSLASANLQATEFASQMQERAIHDDLTLLLNRRGFLEAMHDLESGATHYALLLIDLDGFKAVNDTLGHKAGDDVLVAVADRLRAAAHPEATVARLGGDEFVIVYEINTGTLSPTALAQRLIEAICQPYLRYSAVRVGCCIGIYAGRQIAADEMLRSADAALYAAKGEGRNRYRIYDDDLHGAANIRRGVERDLASAIANKQLEVWYQPIMRDFGRTLDSFEALLRWKHETYGWISPPEIVAAATATGLADRLLTFVLSDVAAALRVLKDTETSGVKIAVNISPREMTELPVDDLILRTLRQWNVPATFLEIEITEETAINPFALESKLACLSAHGVRIAIDDFGAGYSVFGSLRQLKANRVKIDRLFVTGLSQARQNRTLIEAILLISNAFGLEVVAEGVETQVDVDCLQELGCSRMQGYFFSKALPLQEAIGWLKQRQEDALTH